MVQGKDGRIHDTRSPSRSASLVSSHDSFISLDAGSSADLVCDAGVQKSSVSEPSQGLIHCPNVLPHSKNEKGGGSRP